MRALDWMHGHFHIAYKQVRNLLQAGIRGQRIQTFRNMQYWSPSHCQSLRGILSSEDKQILGNNGRCQKLLCGFFPLKGYPPSPTTLTENHFAQKPLAERGGTPPSPLNGKSAKLFREIVS